VNGRAVVVGDHTQNAKEGRCMPGVRNLRQTSETSSKPSYYRGHIWGALTLIFDTGCGLGSKLGSCIWLEMHRFGQGVSMTERPVQAALEWTKTHSEKAYLVLDAFFATGPALKLAIDSGGTIDILTRGKSNIVAYEPPPVKENKGRGRPAKYGPRIELMQQFDRKSASFTEATVDGDEIRYCTRDLCWKPLSATKKVNQSKKEIKAKAKSSAAKPGKPAKATKATTVAKATKATTVAKAIKPTKPTKAAKEATVTKLVEPATKAPRLLRFFLIESAKGRIILMSTDLTLTADDAYRLYRGRPAIESFFRVFKNLFGGFDSHFWSRHIKPSSRTAGHNKNSELDARGTSIQAQNALKATEAYAVTMAILCGAVQQLALNRSAEIFQKSGLWLRTRSAFPSEFLLLMLIRDQAPESQATSDFSQSTPSAKSSENPARQLGKAERVG
jgi:hypothetical protein